MKYILAIHKTMRLPCMFAEYSPIEFFASSSEELLVKVGFNLLRDPFVGFTVIT
jgi:hypothetical protein